MRHDSPRVTLFHGIALAPERADEVEEDIRLHGLRPPPGSRHYPVTRFSREEAARLSGLPDLDRESTRPEDAPRTDWVFACGDQPGAEVYASRGVWQVDEPVRLMVEVEVDLDALVVDGNDFLHRIAMLVEDAEARDAIGIVYGPACVEHVLRGRGQPKGVPARVDLACQDPEVVLHHLGNKAVVAGSHGTRFRSSFMFAAGSGGARVLRTWRPASPATGEAAAYDVNALYQGARRRVAAIAAMPQGPQGVA